MAWRCDTATKRSRINTMALPPASVQRDLGCVWPQSWGCTSTSINPNLVRYCKLNRDTRERKKGLCQRNEPRENWARLTQLVDGIKTCNKVSEQIFSDKYLVYCISASFLLRDSQSDPPSEDVSINRPRQCCLINVSLSNSTRKCLNTLLERPVSTP